MDFCGMHMVYYDYWNPSGTAMFQICISSILAFWKRNCVWKWNVLIFGKFNLDPVLWLGNGIGKPDNWFSLVHYDCWNSIWEAVF